ncbi:MAG TPA: hypothetical protein VGA55_01720, partial [Bacteroidota bacterium]
MIALGLAKRRAWSNKLAGLMISLGGGGVIAVVVAIFIFIGYETIPLWTSPSSVTVQAVDFSGSRVLAVGQNEYRTAGFAVLQSGDIVFFDPSTAQTLHAERLVPQGTTLRWASLDQSQRFLLVVDSNGVALLKIISIDYREGAHAFSSAHLSEFISFPFGDSIPNHIDFAVVSPEEFLILASYESGRLRLSRVKAASSLFGGSTPEVTESEFRD